MFEAADPEVFGWYIKNHGPEVNLFVDHSQIVQLESLRSEPGEPRASGGAWSLIKLPEKRQHNGCPDSFLFVGAITWASDRPT